MNSLSTNLINQYIKSSKEIEKLLNAFSDFNNFPLNIEGLEGSFHAFLLEEIITKTKKNVLFIVPTEKDASDILCDLETALPNEKIFCLPWWGNLPYRSVAKGSSIFGKRSAFLSALVQSNNKTENISNIFIVTQRSFDSPLPPPEYIKSLCITLNKGDEIDTETLSSRLSELGYLRVPKVSIPGEFTIRGEVLDIFLPCQDDAVRIVLDFTKIEKIKTFDNETQGTISEIQSITIFPMKEILWNRESILRLTQNLTLFEKDSIKNNTSLDILEASDTDNQTKRESAHLSWTQKAKVKLDEILFELSEFGESEGEELLYPLAWEKQYSLLDYITDDTLVIHYDYDRLKNAQSVLLREHSGMYRKMREDFPVLPPNVMLFDYETLSKNHKSALYYRSLHTEETNNNNVGDSLSTTNQPIIKITCEAPRSFFGNLNYLKEQLDALLNDGYHIFIFAGGENQALRIETLLKEYVENSPSHNFNPLKIIPKGLSSGFNFPETKLLVIQENEIFGRRKHPPKSIQKAKSQALDTFVELNPGDYVVHVNYGIALFKEIKRVRFLETERDYILLEYADNEYLHVPIEQVNLVQRYIGNEGEKPRLDRLGSKSWENRKNKVKASVEELAKKLIDLYSRRKASKGFPFPKDSEWQIAFEAAFPYEDTPDQITVTQEVKADMEKPIPMDRLICGDVGYGKTEIAMRAAFKAILGGKQVAFLSPTTILAEQHYETCLERFKNFPITIKQLSRFVPPNEQKKILADLETGSVDLLIGTHRIIQKDVKFKNLGLMIIDEEQRFGVKDKEKLKELKNNIDCLAMSATPIPRTLHMSLLKIRDMSLLTTPPQNRQAIETIIDEYSDEKIINAIRREIERGGQVFYLHNRVETLEETRLKIEHLMPEILVDIAHGQMTSETLDDIFHRFKMGGFHVLVATTIIENGIDIPNVNTIIIDRADMYGISQLYQLRGRVGRSDRKAYAYLLYPENKSLSDIAMKRLQVISDFTELGSGFKIAMKDMEIRGAGNLLGRDQSGDVYSVGFDMYLRLLNEAVSKLTAQNDFVSQPEVLMELEYTGFIPDTYVHNPQTKMEIYKKVAAVQTKPELEAVYEELADRFGSIPDEVLSLLTLAEIRIVCKSLYISTIKETNGVVKIEFSKVSDINVQKVLRLMKENPKTIKLDPNQPNALIFQVGKIGLKEKSAFICEKLEFLM